MRIMVAEDDPTSRELLAEILRADGHEVVEAADGKEALEELQRPGAPRIAILDWVMPKMDGLEVCRRIRSRAGWGYTYVLVTTARGERFDVEKGFDAGADDYLVKPLDMSDLRQRLRVAQRILAYEEQQEEGRRQMERLASEMQELAEERARQLVHADRLATLGTLSAGVAHEINNPATFIAGNAQTIERAWALVAPKIADDGSDGRVGMVVEEFPKMVKGIREGVARIARIVEGLKSYSRQGAVEMRPFSLEEAVDACLALCRNALKQGVGVERKMPAGLPRAMGDIRQIEQVIMNLLTNAADALAGQPDARLSIEAALEGRFIRFAVTDNGPGMTPEAIARVFDPFYTTKGEGKGTGLGLPISKGIVEAHGGRMDAWNVAGGGAQFSFTLPMAEKEAAE